MLLCFFFFWSPQYPLSKLRHFLDRQRYCINILMDKYIHEEIVSTLGNTNKNCLWNTFMKRSIFKITSHIKLDGWTIKIIFHMLTKGIVNRLAQTCNRPVSKCCPARKPIQSCSGYRWLTPALNHQCKYTQMKTY